MEKKLHLRGGFIADKMGSGAHMSAAKSIIDHLRDWLISKNHKVSMGVILPKPLYGLPEGLCFSLPVMCLGDGNYRIIENLPLDEYQRTRISEGKQELEQEKEVVFNYLSATNLDDR
jgi:malate/lactate dehydrogenase